MKTFIPLILVSLMAVGSAQAAHVNVEAGITMANPSSNATSPTYSSGTGITGGATLEFALVPVLLDLEVGLLSVGYKFGATAGGVKSDVTTRAWEVPVMVRFVALPLVDFGAGLYFQKFNSTYDTDTAGVKVTGLDWGSQAKTSDMGTKISARLMLPVAPMMHFLVDANYKLGLKDLSTVSGVTFKNRELGVLAGLAIGF
jgi:hypothetical protein